MSDAPFKFNWKLCGLLALRGLLRLFWASFSGVLAADIAYNYGFAPALGLPKLGYGHLACVGLGLGIMMFEIGEMTVFCRQIRDHNRPVFPKIRIALHRAARPPTLLN
mgnify:CR=1 FL=1